MKKITENNILLAEFLDMLTTDSEGNIKEDVNSFKFHNDWNWLMPVVEKIEPLDVTVEIEGHNCMISDTTDSGYHQYVAHDSKINAVYVSVVAFIKWYSEHKSKAEVVVECWHNPADDTIYYALHEGCGSTVESGFETEEEAEKWATENGYKVVDLFNITSNDKI